jgi:GNAT superfamily N-acetyltransferase
MRFLYSQPKLSDGQLDYLTAVDHVSHEALIAVDPEGGQSFGTARCIRSDERAETAEFAVGVGDRWMGIGLGTALLRALILRATEMGIIRFTAVIHIENTAIRRLVEKVVGAYETKWAGPGAAEMAFDLERSPGSRGGGGRAQSSGISAQDSARKVTPSRFTKIAPVNATTPPSNPDSTPGP